MVTKTYLPSTYVIVVTLVTTATVVTVVTVVTVETVVTVVTVLTEVKVMTKKKTFFFHKKTFFHIFFLQFFFTKKMSPTTPTQIVMNLENANGDETQKLEL